MKQVRRQAHLTQSDFASRFGVTRDIVASWENGRVDPPEAVVRLICREFDVSYPWLKNGEMPMSVPDEAVALNQMDRIMNGDNEFMKSVFRELANLPADAWKEINAFVDRLNATDTKNL
ncbi:MAG TPA: helix-turn-helix transcriptional regulator [Candidatus Limiplasma sp.]|nr:helix-turn-helix transcriptional regulator [Candidatus Limiplasma sp.]